MFSAMIEQKVAEAVQADTAKEIARIAYGKIKAIISAADGETALGKEGWLTRAVGMGMTVTPTLTKEGVRYILGFVLAGDLLDTLPESTLPNEVDVADAIEAAITQYSESASILVIPIAETVFMDGHTIHGSEVLRGHVKRTMKQVVELLVAARLGKALWVLDPESTRQLRIGLQDIESAIATLSSPSPATLPSQVADQQGYGSCLPGGAARGGSCDGEAD